MAVGGTVEFSTDENGTYSAAIPTGSEIQAYTIWYHIKGDGNHNDTDPKSLQVTISKAVPKVNWPDASAIELEQPLSSSTLSGGIATVNGVRVEGTFAWENGTTVPGATDGDRTQYAVVFTPNDTDRYESVTGYTAVHINLRHQTGFVAHTETDVIYSPDKTYAITASGGQTDTGILYEVTTGADVISIERTSYKTLKAGTAVITVTRLSDGVYANAVVNLTITVDRAEGTLTSISFDDVTQGTELTWDAVTNSDGEITLVYVGTGDTVYGPSSNTPTEVGTYRVTATLQPNDRYSGGATAEDEFAIIAPPDDPGSNEPGTDTPGTDTPGSDEPGSDDPGSQSSGGGGGNIGLIIGAVVAVIAVVGAGAFLFLRKP